MKKINNLTDYVTIANLFQSPSVNISVAYKGENTLNNFYIINEFIYDKSDLYIFKKIFSIYSSPKKPEDFVDFFVEEGKFYAVFKYNEATNIKERYNKNLSTTAFDDRCTMLEMILIKIDNLMKFPYDFVGCISEPENIKVDDDKNIHLTYNLKNIAKYRGGNLKAVFENIHDIIYNLLPSECDAGFNKQLHIVLDKCKNGVYNSIPELIIELKNAEKISKASSWITYIKFLYELKKPLIKKISRTSVATLLVAGVIYLVYSKLTEGQQSNAAANVSIGNISYNGNAEDESDKTISTENQDNQTNSRSGENITLTQGLDIEYEDYIVQYGDTITSICEQYYKDKKYITAISTFNGLDVETKLTAGTILKLPNRTAIAMYTTK